MCIGLPMALNGSGAGDAVVGASTEGAVVGAGSSVISCRRRHSIGARFGERLSSVLGIVDEKLSSVLGMVGVAALSLCRLCRAQIPHSSFKLRLGICCMSSACLLVRCRSQLLDLLLLCRLLCWL